MFTVKEVSNKKQRRHFLMFPWKVYKDYPCWVPPLLSDVSFCLDEKKNPFYQHAQHKLFLAYDRDEVVGRIVGIIDENNNQYHREKVGFFGFFECLPRFEIAKALLDAVKDWIKSQGMNTMRGPVNPSMNETCAFLVSGFDDPPYFMMSYNPPYYPKFMEKYGLKKKKDLLAYEIDLPSPFMAKLIPLAKKIEKKYSHIKVRSINIKHWREELEKIQEIYNNAWSENWGFVPMTEAEINVMAKRLKPLIIPELVFLAEIRNEPVGFAMFFPDYYQILRHFNGRLPPWGWLKILWLKRHINRIRVMTMGIKKHYRNIGIPILFSYHAGKVLENAPYRRLEFSWILEDNLPAIRTVKLTGAKMSKVYRIYEQPI